MEKNESTKLKALSDIASIDISLEFNLILQRILQITCKAMNAHSGTIMLVDETTGELRMVSSHGLPEDYIERVYAAADTAGVPITSSPSGTVLKTGNYYVVSNIFQELKDEPWYELSKRIGFTAQIFTPMKRGSKVIGLLNVYMKEVHDFTDEEIYFMNIAASQASSVVQNSRMCSKLKKNIRELRDHEQHLEEKIKETHKVLFESENKYRELFEKASDAIYTIDITGYFQTINNAGCNILKAAKEDIIGTHISKWLTSENLESAKQRIKRHASKAAVKESVIYELVCNDGQHRFAEIRTRPIIKDGSIIGIHGMGRDITEKRRLEEKLHEYHEKLQRSYEELMEADRAKTEFVSNITHELLTPLTSIRGFVELLGEGTIGTINPEQKKSLDIILRNSDRLIRLIRELLDSTRLDDNTFVLQLKNVSLENIILKSIQDIHPQANEKQIIIIREIQPLVQIWGDDERLMQVIRNILINAIKFTPQKGKITIKSSTENEHVKISISDTGIGIPKDKLKSIFERFYQVDGSASRKYGGVGLGLSICKSIIDKHHGTIWAESEGNGSTFHILLPKYKSKYVS